MNILSIDGGGAKGVYTLGILGELEQSLGARLCDRFDLIYGVSTGSIIASLLGLGKEVGEIREMYFDQIPAVLGARYPNFLLKKNAVARSQRLEHLAEQIFGETGFEDFLTQIGIVATRMDHSRPMIFKNDLNRAFSRKSSFFPGFGVAVKDAVEASCSAVPFFRPKTIESDALAKVDVVDGGFSANNPSLYSMTDAVGALGKDPKDISLLSLGTGVFPEPRAGIVGRFIKERELIRLFQVSLDSSSTSMEQLTQFLFPTIRYVRVNDEYADKAYAADLLETDLNKLDKLEALGKESFGTNEKAIDDLWIT